MWEAWQLGHELLEELGERSTYGAMKERAADNPSLAEKLRKYRAMANVMTEAELETICELCEQHGKAWGPTFLVALGRLPRVRDRRKLAKQAIRNGWGLDELQRRIRREIGPQRDAKLVGRKRQVDLMSETAILEQIQGLCLSWIRLNTQLQQTSDRPAKAGLALLPKKLREEFTEVATLIAELQQRAEKRLEKSRS